MENILANVFSAMGLGKEKHPIEKNYSPESIEQVDVTCNPSITELLHGERMSVGVFHQEKKKRCCVCVCGWLCLKWFGRIGSSVIALCRTDSMLFCKWFQNHMNLNEVGMNTLDTLLVGIQM